MGQYYTVAFATPTIRKNTTEEALVAAMHDWASKTSMSEDSRKVMMAAVTVRDLVEAIFGPYVPTREQSYDPGYDYGWDINNPDEWTASFHGSYGWESLMYEAFKVMGLYLEEGSYLSCYPDSGSWTLVVQSDGSVLEQDIDCDEDDEDEEGPDKFEIMNDYFDSYETIVETDEGNYYFPAQGDLGHCYATALTLHGNAGIINVSLDGCKEGQENIPLWSNGEWEDENSIYEAIRKQKAEA